MVTAELRDSIECLTGRNVMHNMHTRQKPGSKERTSAIRKLNHLDHFFLSMHTQVLKEVKRLAT